MTRSRDNQRLPLSDEARLVFVLRRSGCVGRLASGWIERSGMDGIQVHTGLDGSVNDYISRDNVRSWCVVGSEGEPLPGWHEITAEDHSRIFQK
jgi:hypothetical protein